MITIVEQPSLFNFGGKLGAYGTKFGRFYICHQLSCNIPAEDVELHLFITYMIIIPKEPILAILGQICGFWGGEMGGMVKVNKWHPTYLESVYFSEIFDNQLT